METLLTIGALVGACLALGALLIPLVRFLIGTKS